MTNQVGQQIGARQEGIDASRIKEFLRMNSLSFTSLSTMEYPKCIVEDLKKVFDVKYVIDADRVKLATYQLKNVPTLGWIS